MRIHQTGIYHIYNRGNDKQKIFFKEWNYDYFLSKCHLYLKPVSEIFAWCLMPNHFHFLIEVTEKSMQPVQCGGIIMPAITNGFRLLQSSYTKGINQQEHRTGNLFQQKTKAKLVSEEDYAVTAFSYIHQNPVKAKLVNHTAEWQYSSYTEYTEPKENILCNTKRAKEVLGLCETDLLIAATKKIDEDDIGCIF